MGLLRTIVCGRRNGIRARVRRLVFGGPASNHTASPPPPSEPPARSGPPEAPREVTPPEGYEVVLHRDALTPGQVREVIVGGRALAIANVDGEIYAVDNSCPHAEGPLGEGTLEGCVLTCPMHGWTYDVTDGSCLTNPDVAVETFDVHVEGPAICVRL